MWSAAAVGGADDHVRPPRRPAVALVEHPVRLADAGRGTDEHLEPSPTSGGRVRLRARGERLRRRTPGTVQNFSGRISAATR
ncbi:hypothetical protein SNE510_42560 [Streptomyces sp. NE5-10]|nr:hypothetical protein SNE510_42560 [Streptomyces sp. NE5-10]